MWSQRLTKTIHNREADIKTFNNTQESKLNFYSNMCEDFGLQAYLKLGLLRSKVRNLTKLRISAHKLQIEVGRYARPKIQRQNRLCSSLVSSKMNFTSCYIAKITNQREHNYLMTFNIQLMSMTMTLLQLNIC